MDLRLSRRRAGPPPRPPPGRGRSGDKGPSEAEKELLARIEAVARNARLLWLGLLGYYAFVGLTLLSVRDRDFFSLDASTRLPLVGIDIPTSSFFWAAPWLSAALHAYLHFHLLKLWDALAAPTAQIAERPLGERLFPWPIADWALRRRPDRDENARPLPLDWLSEAATFLLVWLAPPLMLGWFWWRSMPAHDPWMTLAIAAALLLSLLVSALSLLHARRRLRERGAATLSTSVPPAAPSRRNRIERSWVVAAALSLALVSWLRTEGGLDHYADRVIEAGEGLFGPIFVNKPDERGDLIFAEEWRERWVARHFLTLDNLAWKDAEGRVIWTPLASIDLAGVELAARPPDWLGRDTAERRFRVEWCRNRGLPADACEKPRHPFQGAARAAWCGEREVGDCDALFSDFDAQFDREWTEQRGEYLANLARPGLRGRDLRGANASGAFLANIDFSGARLEGADLSGARLEGANLHEARLEGANLHEARLEGAYLRDARLEGANLFKARLEGANLRWARLEGADLWGARLEGADLYEARLEGAHLSVARLEGANLRWARLEGADLWGARLEGADLYEARLEGAHLSVARLEGANLWGARLEEAYLGGARLEEANLSGAKLQSADWAGAGIKSSPAQSADFTGGRNLTQSQLLSVIGDDETILGRDAETGAQLYVLSCWAELPAYLRLTLSRYPEAGRERLRAEWLCGVGETPRRVGRPAPLTEEEIAAAATREAEGEADREAAERPPPERGLWARLLGLVEALGALRQRW